ncbi:23S rRNA pseudouridine(955/2504/2580) synthase RluC [Psychrobium sp. 1_MG-2023]|nr:23S rRNA pseudouridine(955/2504/2580) synthase RluC [Psychrobium sp. 1_MG-2023]MDP2562220.1 23S rRNA pseudouridine(955/2504/2580) synthase RluC [Psychrobium sp. 1_MG-2023]PKF58079.1 23S rRNA pseudouridine(955/2504/2580) synthase RluC [Alteromonadales bacterium alter-6D02]
MTDIQKQDAPKVQFVTIDDNHAGQRIDNFLVTFLKGVPKSRVYRILRKGEVRVNKKRIKPVYRLADGDIVRIPPIHVSEEKALPNAKLEKIASLEKHIIFEDKYLMVINKPSGIAVHGGSGLKFGLIEGLRALRPDAKFLELVHRLDRDTSGCILVAKRRSTLRALHEQLREKTVEKNYLALVLGQWDKADKAVNAPLLKNTLQSGERIVRVNPEGKESYTKFKIVQRFENCTLVQASPVTGRTHQIRVHTLHTGHPIAGDDKYGDRQFDSEMKKSGLNRLFLHSASLRFFHPNEETTMFFEAPMDDSLKATVAALRKT